MVSDPFNDRLKGLLQVIVTPVIMMIAITPTITTHITVVITTNTQMSVDNLRTRRDGNCYAVTVYQRISDRKILLYYPVRVA